MSRSPSSWAHAVLLPVLLATLAARAQEPDRNPAGAVVDEPAAHALYDRMIQALRSAETLSFQSTYDATLSEAGPPSGRYRMWLKKPNYFRMENYAGDQVSGVLVGDGRNLWIYWPGGKPSLGADNWPQNIDSDQVYLTKPAPPGGHSILHEAPYIGAQIILDPSMFHGYTDSLEPYLDGVRPAGTGQADGQPCDLIELSFLHGQRSWKLWIARSDHLPRRIEETVRLANTITRGEQAAMTSVLAPSPSISFLMSSTPSGLQR